MNYSLGRAVPAEDRSHIAGCKKCRKTLARLEDQALAQGHEMQGQASVVRDGGSGRPGGAPDRSGNAGPDLNASYGW